jgi:hypothetical protein
MDGYKRVSASIPAQNVSQGMQGRPLCVSQDDGDIDCSGSAVGTKLHLTSYLVPHKFASTNMYCKSNSANNLKYTHSMCQGMAHVSQIQSHEHQTRQHKQQYPTLSACLFGPWLSVCLSLRNLRSGFQTPDSDSKIY